MKMIRTRNAILLRTGKTKLTASTYSAREPDSNKGSNLEPCVVRYVRSEGDNPADSLVATDMWELDVCDWLAVRSSSGTGFGV